MTDKEKLNKIKEKYMEREYDYALCSIDIDWLIEQAERVQELEEKHKKYVAFTESNNYNMDVEFEKLYKQNKRYREALEEIKKEETVTTGLSKGQVAYTRSGHIARKALEE